MDRSWTYASVVTLPATSGSRSPSVDTRPPTMGPRCRLPESGPRNRQLRAASWLPEASVRPFPCRSLPHRTARPRGHANDRW